MYQVNDLIVYGHTGVCRIKAISTPEMDGLNPGRLYYVLSPLYQDGLIYTPVDNDKVLMRPVVSAQEAHALIDLIPTIDAKAYNNSSAQQLASHYQEILKSCACQDLIEMTMSIYAKKRAAEEQKRKLGQVDSKFMKRAEDMLFGELAVALDIPADQVPAYIRQRVGEVGVQ